MASARTHGANGVTVFSPFLQQFACRRKWLMASIIELFIYLII